MSAQSSTPVVCVLCGVDDARTKFEAGVAQINRIVECRQCGLMYSSPRAKPADQDRIRKYDPEISSKAALYNPARYKKEARQVRDYEDTRRLLAALYPDRGLLLELGCGMGFLMAEFSKDGWHVLGIEPNRGFCQFIKEHHNLEALPTILEDSGIAAESIDVVIFLHVIEHLPDPLATLRAIHRVLKPGGHLVIETPRYDSLMFRLLRHRERSLSCEGHIYFFTTDTLRRLYQAAGFVERQLKYVGRSLSLDRLMWNVGVISKSRIIRNTLATISNALNFEAVHVRLNMRDMQRVLVQKPKTLANAPTPTTVPC